MNKPFKQTSESAMQRDLAKPDPYSLSPLFYFYVDATAAYQACEFNRVSPERMTDPYRSLLVHKGDMTPTLEAFHSCELTLKVIQSQKTYSSNAPQQSPRPEDLKLLRRQVILRCHQQNKAVEFGAIEIFADQFPVWARKKIAACQTPLGTILGQWEALSQKNNQPLGHHSIPSSYFNVQADSIMADYFSTTEGTLLWGRTNQLLTSDMSLLANVVEILSPVHEAATEERA